MLSQDLYYSFIVKIVDCQTIVSDSRVITGTPTQGDKLGTVTYLKYDCVRLTCCDGHTKQPLIPRQ